MKYLYKIFIALLFIIISLNSAYANIPLLNDEENQVDLYGTIRGYIGYGYNIDSAKNINSSNMLYGLQNNSRIGINFITGRVFGRFELGAQEPTLLTSAKNVLGIRHFYAGYQFNNNGSLVTGKMDAPSVLSAFFSEILDLDGGGNGFGGIGTGSRRFQIQYRTPFGLDFALIEYDLLYGRQTVAKAEYIPRVAVSYTYKKESLYAKIAGTYGILNGELVDTKSANTNSPYGTVHAFHIGGAVKKIIGNFHFAVLASYGMNANLYNEQKTVYSNGGYMHQKLNSMTIGGITYNGIDLYIVDENGKISNVTRVSAYAEFGYKIVPSFSLIAGGGYQYTQNDSAVLNNLDIHSYSVFIQAPFTLSKNFSIITQAGWYDTIGIVDNNSENLGAFILITQLRATF